MQKPLKRNTSPFLFRIFYAAVATATLFNIASVYASDAVKSQHAEKAQASTDMPAAMKYPDLYRNHAGMKPVFEDDGPSPRPQAPTQVRKPAAAHMSDTKIITLEEPPIPAKKPSRAPDTRTVVTNSKKVVTQPALEPTLNKPQKQAQPAVQTPDKPSTQTEQPKPKQGASTPQSPKPKNTATAVAYLEISFQKGKSDLAPYEQAVLDKEIVPILRKDPAMNVLVEGYAPNNPDTMSGARRMSLSRALMIREYLLSKGVTSAKIDVMVKGNDALVPAKDSAKLILFRKDNAGSANE